MTAPALPDLAPQGNPCHFCDRRFNGARSRRAHERYFHGDGAPTASRLRRLGL